MSALTNNGHSAARRGTVIPLNCAVEKHLATNLRLNRIARLICPALARTHSIHACQRSILDFVYDALECVVCVPWSPSAGTVH